MIDYQKIVEMARERDQKRAKKDRFRRIDGSAELARLTSDNIALPSCFIAPDQENVTQSGNDSVIINCQFSVIIGVNHAHYRHGFGAEAELNRHRSMIFDGLFSKTIDFDDFDDQAQSRPINWTGGQRLEFDQHNLWWRDAYQVEICADREFLAESSLVDFDSINLKPSLQQV